MGIFDNAIKKAEEKAKQELDEILITGEILEESYLAKEDYCALTNKRLIFVDKSFSSSKKALTAIPYSKISFVALKRGGAFTITKEIIVYVGSKEIEIELYDTAQALHIFKYLSEKIV